MITKRGKKLNWIENLIIRVFHWLLKVEQK